MSDDTAQRFYPLRNASKDKDPRFSLMLLEDLSRVLQEHGFPSALTNQGDASRLQVYLFRFLYGLPRFRGKNQRVI